jgi:transposase
MSRSRTDRLARQRATLILQVRTGQLTASQAAQQLNISRQRYYKWEKRALQALLRSLQDQPKGRPRKAQDLEKEKLQLRVKQLQAQVQRFEQKEKLRQLLKTMEERPGRSSTKKNSK